ncbi:MAG: glycosyltransferase family 4 protein [Myxococcota bacterium]
MQIGIVSEYYRPWPGGISEHVHHEAVELRRRGHHVTILTGPASGSPREVPSGGDAEGERDVLRLGFEIRFTSNGALSRFALGRELFAMRALLRRLKLDLVHVHAPMDPFLALAALAASEVATVGTFHASFAPSALWDGLYRKLRFVTGPLFRRMHARIAVSEEAERSISHYFPDRYEIIPNGVDTQRFHPGLEPLPEFSTGGPTILFVGRADPRKGLRLLLAAFESVRRRVPGARLVVVGVEPAEVARAHPGLDLDRAEGLCLAGYVPTEVLPRYYASCDVFCSPATGQESQGIVLLEAMATGRPPVIFDIPGYRNVVTHKRDGWIVPECDAGLLAEALVELLRNPELRAELASAGPETAGRYAWPGVVQRLETVFSGAVAEREKSRSERPRPC